MNQRRKLLGQKLLFGGLIAQMSAIVALTSMEHPSTTGLVTSIVAVTSTIVYIAGLAVYVKAKGHHPAWSLLGLLSLFGLSIVLALPDLE
jgi:uncharacterized membrane-anchored protein